VEIKTFKYANNLSCKKSSIRAFNPDLFLIQHGGSVSKLDNQNFFDLQFKPDVKISGDVSLLDTTLREGEQTPNVFFKLEDKIKIAQLLDEFGVHMIEAGCPTVSKGVKAAVKAIAEQGLKAEVLAHVRAKGPDIEEAVECNVDRVAVFIATSDIHLEFKLKKTREQILGMIYNSVNYARNHGLKVRFTPEDATRSDPQFLIEACHTAHEAGADRISIADTVGMLTPSGMKGFVKFMQHHLGNSVSIDVHCHNDLGLAAANALAGLEAGANCVHATVNGLGERTGITGLEEISVALSVIYGLDLGFKLDMLPKIARYVERASGVVIGQQAVVIGDYAFSHKAGIHTAGVLANPKTYEVFSPDLVGRGRQILVDRYAGKKAVEQKLKELGILVSDDQLSKIVQKIKEVADAKRNFYDEDILEIAEEILQVSFRGISPSKVMGLISCKVDSSYHTSYIVRRMSALPLDRVYETSGEYEIVAIAQAESVPELNDLLEKIREIDGIAHTNTKVILKQFETMNSNNSHTQLV
jgi:2-isopropylmalate synthase